MPDNPLPPPEEAPPPCPSCGSANVVLAHQNMTRRFFYCTDCRHQWDGPRTGGVPEKNPNGRT